MVALWAEQGRTIQMDSVDSVFSAACIWVNEHPDAWRDLVQFPSRETTPFSLCGPSAACDVNTIGVFFVQVHNTLPVSLIPSLK